MLAPLFAAGVALQCPSCSGDESGRDALAERRQPTGLRVLLVGLDGATWDVVDPLVEAGELPNLANLLHSGARASLVPALSSDPELGWVSILTGQTLWESGIDTPLPWDPELGKARPARSSDRLVPSLFEILDAAGLRSLVLGFDLAWPAESPSLFVSSEVTGDARMQAARATRGSARTLPAELESELRSLLVDGKALSDEDLEALGELPEWFVAESRASLPVVGHAPTYWRHALASQLNVERVALHLLQQGSFDFVAVELDALAVGHALWHHLGSDVVLDAGLERDERLRDLLLGILRHDDRFLGRLVEALGPDTVVLVVGSYGYRTSASAGAGELPLEALQAHFFGEKPATLHLTLTGSPDANGVLLFSGGPVRAGEVNATQLDLLPTIAALLGIPAARDLPGRIPADLLDGKFLDEHASEPVASFAPFLQVEPAPSSESE